MNNTYHYPDGTVRALLNTNQVTEATRQALTERLNQPPYQPVFFSNDEYETLRAVSNRLILQDRVPSIDVVAKIDERLSKQKANGWRYDVMPDDGVAYRKGIEGINESSRAHFGQTFIQLPDEQQDAVLRSIQQGKVSGSIWQQLPANRFFEEVLAETVENYYSHPLAQEEIGYVGMADVPTWQRVGLDQLEDREPRPLIDNV